MAGPEIARQPEVVSGGTDAYAGTAGMRRVLPAYISNIDADLGLQIWERMYRDPAAGGAVDTLQDAILDDGIRLQPARTVAGVQRPDPDLEAEAVKAQELMDFVQAALDRLELEDQADTSIEDVARDLLDGLWMGFRVAEVVWEIEGGRLLPGRIKPKPNRNVRFVTDPYGNLVGVVGATVGPEGVVQAPPSQALGSDIEKALLPPERVLRFTHRTRNNDPRGWSVFDRAYNAWHLKVSALPEYFRYLKQFGTPTIVGKTWPNAVHVLDASGETKSPEVILFEQLLQFLNASVLTVPHGTEVDLLFSQGTGEAFRLAEEFMDRQIALAIHGSTRLLLEAEHGSRADGGVAQDVVGLRVRRGKKLLGACLTRFVRRMIELNFPPDVHYLAPSVTLADIERQDQAQMIEACSTAYASGYIHASQLPELHRSQGLPEADYESMDAERQEEADRRRLAAGEFGRFRNPGDPADDGLDEE